MTRRSRAGSLARAGSGHPSRSERRRSHCDVMGWEESYTRLRSEREPTPDDLGRLAEAAYMLGREDEYLRALERAYQAHLDAGAARAAARCASGRA